MKYPNIIDKSQQEQANITLHLFIPTDIIFFQGHFPETPILPGVVQLDWALFFAHKFFNIDREKFLHVSQVKFSKVINPNATLFLSLKLENNTLIFKYFNDNCVYSSGTVKT